MPEGKPMNTGWPPRATSSAERCTFEDAVPRRCVLRAPHAGPHLLGVADYDKNPATTTEPKKTKKKDR